jgi:hypothetical protein
MHSHLYHLLIFRPGDNTPKEKEFKHCTKMIKMYGTTTSKIRNIFMRPTINDIIAIALFLTCIYYKKYYRIFMQV